MIGIQSAFIAALSYILSVTVLFRCRKQKRVIRSLLLLGMLQVPLYCTAFMVKSGFEGELFEFLNGLLVYGALFYCLSHPIVVLNTSLTIALISLMDREGVLRLDYDGIRKWYPYSEIISKRLQRMVISGYLVLEGDFFCITTKVRRPIKAVTALKKFLHCYPGG